ncbi:MAG: hypothetical protein ABJ251_04710, partial [Paracoccaceae bacterium]
GSDQEFLTSVAFILLIFIALCTVCLGLFLHYKRYFFDIKSNQICYYIAAEVDTLYPYRNCEKD